MVLSEGLTGIKEKATGFVGRQPLADKTISGKSRMRFELACGENKEEFNKFTTWRHCIVYGDKIEPIKNIKKGDLVTVHGWVTTEAVLDEEGKQLLREGRIVTREYLILYSGEIQDYKQSPEKQLPLVVGLASKK